MSTNGQKCKIPKEEYPENSLYWRKQEDKIALQLPKLRLAGNAFKVSSALIICLTLSF